MYLRTPIEAPPGRSLRILLYARYSTEEQDASSIPDQYQFCRTFLQSQDITDADFTELSDAETSGELLSRPGIDRVRAGIAQRRWDLGIVEDSSRFFRDIAASLRLVGDAIDQGMRVLCLNDDVDTTEEDWQDRLTEAAKHHARSNRFTSKRIKRKHESLWAIGAAIGLLKAGYLRRASVPASLGEPAKGPFFDDKDPRWEPVIYEAYERTSNLEPPWSVGLWLTAAELPKCGNSSKPEWTDANVIALIRRLDHRGVQEYRNTVAKKHYGTGKRKPAANTSGHGPMTRDMPHLRIVPDWLWHAANNALTRRAPANENRKAGRDHVLYGVPRDSRGPLSHNFFCGICGSKMYQAGRGEGGYRCSQVRNRHNPCWNKATAYRDLTHQAIGNGIAEQLVGSQEHLTELVAHVGNRLQEVESVAQLLGTARAEERRIQQAVDNLIAMVERLGANPGDALERLEAKLLSHDSELRKCRVRIDQLVALERNEEKRRLAPEQIAATIRDVSAKLLDMDSEASDLIRRLAPRILAMPYQQFNSNKVVLRAKFELELASLLPQRLSAILKENDTVPDAHILTIPLCVDLFIPSSGPRFGLRAAELSNQRIRLVDIGEKLGLSKRSAHVASEYGKAMTKAGIVDPYVELTEPPAGASRWR